MKKTARMIAGEMLKDERTLYRLVGRNSFADVYWEVIRALTARSGARSSKSAPSSGRSGCAVTLFAFHGQAG